MLILKEKSNALLLLVLCFYLTSFVVKYKSNESVFVKVKILGFEYSTGNGGVNLRVELLSIENDDSVFSICDSVGYLYDTLSGSIVDTINYPCSVSEFYISGTRYSVDNDGVYGSIKNIDKSIIDIGDTCVVELKDSIYGYVSVGCFLYPDQREFWSPIKSKKIIPCYRFYNEDSIYRINYNYPVQFLRVKD